MAASIIDPMSLYQPSYAPPMALVQPPVGPLGIPGSATPGAAVGANGAGSTPPLPVAPAPTQQPQMGPPSVHPLVAFAQANPAATAADIKTFHDRNFGQYPLSIQGAQTILQSVRGAEPSTAQPQPGTSPSAPAAIQVQGLTGQPIRVPVSNTPAPAGTVPPSGPIPYQSIVQANAQPGSPQPGLIPPAPNTAAQPVAATTANGASTTAPGAPGVQLKPTDYPIGLPPSGEQGLTPQIDASLTNAVNNPQGAQAAAPAAPSRPSWLQTLGNFAGKVAPLALLAAAGRSNPGAAASLLGGYQAGQERMQAQAQTKEAQAKADAQTAFDNRLKTQDAIDNKAYRDSEIQDVQDRIASTASIAGAKLYAQQNHWKDSDADAATKVDAYAHMSGARVDDLEALAGLAKTRQGYVDAQTPEYIPAQQAQIRLRNAMTANYGVRTADQPAIDTSVENRNNSTASAATQNANTNADNADTNRFNAQNRSSLTAAQIQQIGATVGLDSARTQQIVNNDPSVAHIVSIVTPLQSDYDKANAKLTTTMQSSSLTDPTKDPNVIKAKADLGALADRLNYYTGLLTDRLRAKTNIDPSALNFSPPKTTTVTPIDRRTPRSQAYKNGQSGSTTPPPGYGQLSQDPSYGAHYVQQIASLASSVGVDPLAIQAIIKQESGGNPQAVNHKNADGSVDYGIMQVNSKTKNPSSYQWDDPASNIAAGIAEFKAKLSAAGGDYKTAFRMYNGSGAKAQQYANTVFSDYQRLKGGAGGSGRSQKVSDGELMNRILHGGG